MGPEVGVGIKTTTRSHLRKGHGELVAIQN